MCLSPYVEEPLNSKVIKRFVPELRSRKCFSCFEIPMFYVYMLWTSHVHFAYSCIWLWYTTLTLHSWVSSNSTKVAASGKRQATLFTEEGKLKKTEVNLVWLLQSGMVFCQVYLRIQNQLVTDIMLRFPVVDNRYCTLIAAYAPSMTKGSEKISSFYDHLDQSLHVEGRQNCPS